VTATKAIGTNHIARASAPVTITIDKAAQTLSLNTIAAKTYGDSDFTATTSATSALTVTLSASPSSVCTVSSHTIHIVSNGNCTITATQVGDANWLAATVASGSSDTRTFAIAAKTLTVSGSTTIGRAYNGSNSATSLLNFSASSLVGVVQGDSVSLDATNASGAFATEIVGANKAITVAGLALSGTHASRYSLTAPTHLSATVTALPITVLGITVPTRVYNGTNVATLATSAYSFTDIVSGDSVTLDDSNYVATFANANVSPTAKVVTVSALALSGSDAQNYVLTQPVLQGLITKATGTVQFATSRTTTYDGSAKALATSTTPSSLSLIHEYNGTGITAYGPSAIAPTNSGSYSLLSTINDINYQGAGTSPWTINKQVVNVLLTGNSFTFNGTARALSAATSPAGKNMVVTYSGTNGTSYNSTFAPVNAGTYTVTAVVDESNFAGSESVQLSIAQASQSALNFADSNTVEFSTTHQLVALGGSGSGAVSYSVVAGSCNVNASSGLLSPTGAGTCVVQATREASTNFTTITSSQRSISISKGTQTVAFTSIVPSNPVKDSTYTPTATSTSGLSVALTVTSGSGSVCSMNNGVVTFIASGICTITATQPGNANFFDATSVTQSIEVGKLNQTITFPQPNALRVGDPAVELGASTSSGLDVQYAVTNGTNVCLVSALGVVSALTSGTCTVTVSQSGDSIYGAASPVSRVLIVSANLPSAPHISSISAGDSTLTIGYVAPSSNGGSTILSYSVVARSATAPTITKSDCGTSPLSCTLLGLVNSSSYTVTVAANNIAGTGSASETADVLIPAPSLEAVRGVSGSRDATTMDVAWEDPATFGDGSFVRYEVAIRERNGVFDAPVTVQSVNGPRTSIGSFVPSTNWNTSDGVVRATTTQSRTVRFSNLNPAVTYETRIVTITTTRTAQTSTNTANALMLPLRVPSAPRALNIDVPDGRTAKISWAAPVADGGSVLTGYAISSNAGTCVHASALATSCVISSLTPGAPLSVSVTASNSIGASLAATASLTTPNTPGVPTISYVTATTSTATISWNPPSNTGSRPISAYAVIATSSTNPSDIARCSTVTTSCVLLGLTDNTNYKVKVRAFNSVGAGAYTSEFSVDTPKIVLNSSAWDTYRKGAPAIAVSQSLSQLPPAPAKVTAQSVTGKRTLVTAVRATKDAAIPVTYAIISVTMKSTNKLITRINVRVDPANPTTSVSVPYASSKVRVNVQFANDIGISAGGPAGVNIAEGNTFESTTIAGEPRILGTEVPGSIYFSRGSAILTKSLKTRLSSVAASAKARGGLVYVTGFATPGELRSAWMLDSLARARAEAVAKYLASLGVRQWITFHGAESTGSNWESERERKVVVATAGINQI
jgi:outer membrane protein OmpA-like peptidoglycan-associated protein